MYGYYPFGFYFDPTYFLVIIGIVICLIAQGYMKSTFNKYQKVRNIGGLTGAEVADRILRMSGISDVRIEHIGGNLTDHYDPRDKVLRLSDATYSSQSVAAIGVAAHECGHAIQHDRGYVPLTLRSAIVPVANLGSFIAWPLIFIGLLFNNSTSSLLLNLGILAFSFAVIFQIITLPVEFNASRRAIKILDSNSILYDEEVGSAKKVLFAAALTYVAGAAASILQLLRIVLLAGNRRN